MSAKLFICALLFIQVFSLHIPSKYLKSIKSENLSNDSKKKLFEKLLIFEKENENRTDNRSDPKPDNRTDNRTDPKPDNRTDNRTDPKPDNRTDNRTDPKPDNRTDNRTDPKPDNRTDNRTDPKPDNRTDNRTDPKPDNRTDNRTDPKPDNRTDNRTDPKPDNRTDNRTDPKPDNRTDNRTDPKPDNRTDNTTENVELVGVNTKAMEFSSYQNISLIFSNYDTNLTLIKNLYAFRTKNRKTVNISLWCFDKENNFTISCAGDFSFIQTGIYVTYGLEYNNKYINLTTPITFYVQKKSYNA